MGRYGLASINAVELIKSGKTVDPILAWNLATTQIFGTKTSMINKGCPKGAFLGLCEEGLIKGIPIGHYTSSIKNKSYAIKAVTILKSVPSKEYTEQSLWEKVIGNVFKKPNQQMDVVITLWKNKYIK